MSIRLVKRNLDLTLFPMRRVSIMVEGIPSRAQELIPDVGYANMVEYLRFPVARGTKALCRPGYARNSCQMSGT